MYSSALVQGACLELFRYVRSRVCTVARKVLLKYSEALAEDQTSDWSSRAIGKVVIENILGTIKMEGYRLCAKATVMAAVSDYFSCLMLFRPIHFHLSVLEFSFHFIMLD